jgi:hypothetical protein
MPRSPVFIGLAILSRRWPAIVGFAAPGVAGNAGWGILASGWGKGSVNTVVNNTRGNVNTKLARAVHPRLTDRQASA